jgi:hypothetical protein
MVISSYPKAYLGCGKNQYVKEIWRELKKEHVICLKLKSFTNINQWHLDWINEYCIPINGTGCIRMHIWEDSRCKCLPNIVVASHCLSLINKVKGKIPYMCKKRAKVFEIIYF